jgi:type II secretory pathway pseudopilin PulG
MKTRGLTLLEVIVAVSITSFVMAMAVSVVNTGVALARKGEQTVASNEAARTAMEMLLRDLRIAGTGAAGGLWMTAPGGTPVRINPIFTQAGANGTDMLWVVVPKPNIMMVNCASRGSAVSVTQSGSGALNVTCNAPALATTDVLMVSNFRTAALISAPTFPSSTQIAFAESSTPGFSSSPEKGGFQRGDMVFPVDLVRYRIAINPDLGRPELLREIGALAVPFNATAPFTVEANAMSQRFGDVEDLQVAFGVGTQPALAFTNGHNTLFDPSAPPLAVRVSVLGITPKTILDNEGKIQPLFPVTVEEHVPANPTVADGYRRSLYVRRIDLTNMNPVNL